MGGGVRLMVCNLDNVVIMIYSSRTCTRVFPSTMYSGIGCTLMIVYSHDTCRACFTSVNKLPLKTSADMRTTGPAEHIPNCQ